MKKIIIEVAPGSNLIKERTTKFISQYLHKEYGFKELETDTKITELECNKLILPFAELIQSYKKVSTHCSIKENLYIANDLCKKFTEKFNEVINGTLIDKAIKAMIVFTWGQVIEKYLKEAIKLSDFLGGQVALLLLNDINRKTKKIW